MNRIVKRLITMITTLTTLRWIHSHKGHVMDVVKQGGETLSRIYSREDIEVHEAFGSGLSPVTVIADRKAISKGAFVCAVEKIIKR